MTDGTLLQVDNQGGVHLGGTVKLLRVSKARERAPEAVHALKGAEGDAAVLLQVVVHHSSAAASQHVQGAPTRLPLVSIHRSLREASKTSN